MVKATLKHSEDKMSRSQIMYPVPIAPKGEADEEIKILIEERASYRPLLSIEERASSSIGHYYPSINVPVRKRQAPYPSPNREESIYRASLKGRFVDVLRDKPLTEQLSQSIVIERYGKMRCMHNNVPSHMAQLLLTGLLSTVPLKGPVDHIVTPKGNHFPKQRYATSGSTLIRSGLMKAEPVKVMRRGRGGASTNYFGYLLLKHWAENRRKFKPFFDAYNQGNRGRVLLTELMLEI